MMVIYSVASPIEIMVLQLVKSETHIEHIVVVCEGLEGVLPPTVRKVAQSGKSQKRTLQSHTEVCSGYTFGMMEIHNTAIDIE